MRSSLLLIIAILAGTLLCSAQNISGLQNKSLSRVDDVGSLLESGLGSLFGGKLTGKVDSVVINQDAEKRLKGKIFYTGYDKGFFTLSCMSSAKQKQNEFKAFRFSQAAKTSPVEFTIDMDASVPPNTNLESPYLRIDVAKRDGGTGNVTVMMLNKKWQGTQETRNMVIDVPLVAVGKAASLSNERKDVTPSKTIQFDPKLLYIRPVTAQPVRKMQTGGVRSYLQEIPYSDLYADISGTWISTDNTSGITKLIVTAGNQIQGFGRCSPQDCDWGKVALTTLNASSFRAQFTWSFKKSLLNISLGANDVLTVSGADTYNDGRAARSYSYTFKKNIVAMTVATKVYTLNQLAVLTPGTPAGPVNKTPKGPDKNVQVNLLDGLSADVDFRRPQDISNININVFADKNLNSGIYYILPADYHLKWEPKSEPEKGYDFRILYGAQQAGGGAAGEQTSPEAPVRMSASLTAGISTRERNFVKELLKAIRPDFTDLRYLPLRESPQFTFQTTLGSQYNIPESKISVERVTDLSGDIKVAWQTDADTKEFIQTSLTSREGISASVILKPDDEEILDQQVPASINLADIRTLGKMNLEPGTWRTQQWRNQTPYPLKLKYIHVMKKEIGGTRPIIYSWSLNDVVVPSMAQAKFDNTRIPTWLDADASVVMWVEYTVDDCLTCDQKVLDAVTGGVSGARAQQVKFVIPPAVFDSLHASYFMITVRSRQADPKGLEMKEFDAVRVTSDMARDFTVGPLYIPSNGSLEFEYKVTAATAGGDFYPSNVWQPATEREVLLGKTKLKEIFRGIIPGIE